VVSDNRGIGAVLLAAGASRRFGAENKLLASVGGKPLIAHVLDALAGAGVAHVVVVTGWDREAVERALQGSAVRLVHNAGWEAGMGGSIAAGVGALDHEIAGAMIVPGDVPMLSAPVVGQLVSAFEQSDMARVVYPTTGSGEQRNPVLWPRRYFAALSSLPAAEGAKSLLRSVPLSDRIGVAVDDAAVIDVDTEAELDAAREGLRRD
jgi:molybdenum cofactor cytidylyltransferase